MPASSSPTSSGTPASIVSPRKSVLVPLRRDHETNETDDEITLKKSPVRSIPIKFLFDLPRLSRPGKDAPLSGSLYFGNSLNPYNFAPFFVIARLRCEPPIPSPYRPC